MAKIGLWNVFFGFLVVTIAACGGIFVAFDLTEIFTKQIGDPNSWYQIIRRSAHGHFNLFGFIHIMFGLSLPYSRFGTNVKTVQSVGLGLATLAMGPAMIWRASLGPTDSFDLNGLVIGIGSACGLLALTAHVLGIAMKATR